MTTDQRTAVVTAAGGGIGRAIVKRLCEQRYTVFALDINPAALASLSAEQPTSQLHTLPYDGTDAASVEQAFRRIGDHGPLHVLVNGVGSTCSGGLRDLSLARWQQMFDLNLTSVFLAARAAVPLMETSDGDRALLTISSTLAAVADHTTLAYGAFKAGLEQFTRALALELAPQHIRALALAPGPVTATGGEAVFDTAENARHNPLGRFATPAEIATLAEFLVSPGASYLTGTVVRLDGGDAALGIGWGPLQALAAAAARS